MTQLVTEAAGFLPLRRNWIPFFFSAVVSVLLTMWGSVLQNRYGDQNKLINAYWSILEDGESGVVLVDHNGNIKAWSNGCRKLFGMSKEEMEGYGLYTIIPPEMREKHRQAFEKNLKFKEDHDIVVIECEAMTKNKSGNMHRTPMNIAIRKLHDPHDHDPMFLAVVNKAKNVHRQDFLKGKQNAGD